MYKGNINDFGERAVAYAGNEYNVELEFRRSLSYPDRFMIIRRTHDGWAVAKYIYDREDLEQQVYDAINKHLKELNAI